MASQAKRRSSGPPKRSASSRPARRDSSVRRVRDVLADIERIVAASGPDLASLLSAVARACVPEVCDVCIVDLVRSARSLERVDAVHIDPSHAETMRALLGPFVPRDDHPVRRVIESRRPLLEASVAQEDLTRLARDPAHLVMLRRFGPRSSIRVPIVARKRVAAVLSFQMTERSRRFSASDLSLAGQIAALIESALK